MTGTSSPSTSTVLTSTLNKDEKIYMQEPPRYKTQGEHSAKRLQKSLYGLKQVGRKVFIVKVDKYFLILTIHIDDCISPATPRNSSMSTNTSSILAAPSPT